MWVIFLKNADETRKQGLAHWSAGATPSGHLYPFLDMLLGSPGTPTNLSLLVFQSASGRLREGWSNEMFRAHPSGRKDLINT